MTPFVIFAIVLTVVYVIYYAVIITIDISSKPDVARATEEVFEIDTDDEVASVVVEESPEGFNVGNNSYVVAEEPVSENDPPEEKVKRFDVRIISDKLQDVEKYYSDSYNSEEMKRTRLKAIGTGDSNIAGSATEEEEDEKDFENFKEAEMDEVMNVEANDKGRL